jgi:tetratricopeptide (TPR) repeat protein
MNPQEREQHIVDTWDFDDAQATFERFSADVESVGPNTADGLTLRTQQGRSLGLQRRFDEASALLDGVATDLDSHSSDLDEADGHHVRARLEIERGRVLNSSGDAAGARPHFDAAYDESMAVGLDGLAVDALHMTAIVVGSIDGPAAATAVNSQAISVAERSSDPAARRWLGSLLNNLGWDRHDAGSYEEALEIFRRALAVRQEQGSRREIEIARWCVGRCLRSLERYSEALDIQETLAESRSGSEDGYVYEEIGENLLALGRDEDAAAYFSRAHELLSDDDWLVDNESERLERLLFLSDE